MVQQLEKIGQYGASGWSDIHDDNVDKLQDHLDNHPAVSNIFYINWEISGALATGTEQGGYRTVPYNSTILAVYATLGERGNTGDNIFDINKGTPPALVAGTPQYDTLLASIYTTPANRPTIAGDTANRTQNAVLKAILPDILSLNQHDILALDIDNAVNNAYDLVVTMVLQKD